MTKWIVWEGPDRCGKTTQMKLADKWLKSIGYPSYLAKDPSPDVASEIRALLLRSNTFHEVTDFLLFLAGRSELYHKVIHPLLEQDVPGIILCDRYRLSTVIYQTVFDHESQIYIHHVLGLDKHPDAYFVYMPKKPLAAPIENWRDEQTREKYRNICERYKQAAESIEVPTFIYEFEDESPEEVFEKFTKPMISKIIEIDL